MNISVAGAILATLSAYFVADLINTNLNVGLLVILFAVFCVILITWVHQNENIPAKISTRWMVILTLVFVVLLSIFALVVTRWVLTPIT